MVERLNDLSRKAADKVLADPRIGGALACGLLLFLGAGAAHAVTTPATGSFAYDVYDIAVNKMLKGPIGFVAGMAAMVFGAVAAIQQRVMAAVPAVLGGAMLLKADSILTTLGALF